MVNKIKKILRFIYNELFYIVDILRYKQEFVYIDNARDQLMEFSPKPNKKIDKLIVDLEQNSKLDLSVIVPIYNSEKYISECLESIINQNTNYKYEIVCIDDGSRDDSASIVEKLILNNPSANIRLIKQENRGHAGAKNRGIAESKGKYIMFVDSDDMILPDMVSNLLNEAYKTNYDIIACGFYTFVNNNEQKKYYLNKRISVDRMNSSIMKNYPCYFCMKVFKRSLWTDIVIPEGFWYEDMLYLFVVTKLCNGYSYLPKALYAYRRNEQGITATSMSKPKSIDQYWMVEYIRDFYSLYEWNFDKDYHNFVLKELGSFLYNRTIGLPINIRKCVFSCAVDYIDNIKNVDEKSLSRSAKRVFKALKNKDFKRWEISSRYWN